MKTMLCLVTAWLCCVIHVTAQTFEWALPLMSEGDDQVSATVTDLQGNVYAAGVFSGVMDVDPGPMAYNLSGDGHVFLNKYSGDGELIWAIAMGPGVVSGVVVPAMDISTSGQITLALVFEGEMDADPSDAEMLFYAPDSREILIATYNEAGELLWAQQYGGSGHETIHALAIDPSGAVIICGQFENTVDFDPGPGETILERQTIGDFNFVLKLDANGNFQWVRQLEHLLHTQMKTDFLGNTFITGFFEADADFDPGAGTFILETGTAQNRAFLLKLDPAGDFVFANAFGGSEDSWSQGITIDATGNVIMTGYTSGAGDFDSGPDTYIVDTPVSLWLGTAFILKVTNDGQFMWAKAFNDPYGISQGQYISCTPNNEVFITGSFLAGTPFDFDPGDGEELLPCQGMDAFVLHLNGNGDYLWAGTYGGASYDYGNRVIYSNGAVYLNGTVWAGPADFDPTTDEYIMDINQESLDAFLIKLQINQCSALELDIETESVACGAGGSATVVATGIEPITYEWNDAQQQSTSTAEDLLVGTYMVHITDGNGCVTDVYVDVTEEYWSCATDFDHDGIIGINDVFLFINAYGCSENCCVYDLDGDGVVSVTDLVTFVSSFGAVCP